MPAHAAVAHLSYQLRHPAGALRRDSPKLRAVTADGIDQHGALPHQQLTGPVKHQHALTIGALDWDEPNGGRYRVYWVKRRQSPNSVKLQATAAILTSLIHLLPNPLIRSSSHFVIARKAKGIYTNGLFSVSGKVLENFRPSQPVGLDVGPLQF